MARFGAPNGVRGWLRMQLFSRRPEFFTQLPRWLCRQAGGEWMEVKVLDCQLRNGVWYALLDGVADRDAAGKWRHGEAAVQRGDLPAPAADETEDYYWCDLVGCQVVNRENEHLGEVADLMENGGHDSLIVRGGNEKDLLIPFVAAYVQDVDLTAATIRVDWQREWSV